MILKIELLSDQGLVILGQQHHISAATTAKILTELPMPIVDGESMLVGMETRFAWEDMVRQEGRNIVGPANMAGAEPGED